MLIFSDDSETKIQFRIRMKDSVLKQIDDYCKWANIKTRDYFIERCCQYIFTKDEEWKKFKDISK